MKPGDIVIRKFRGVKTKFRVLGLDDVITENCFQCLICSEFLWYAPYSEPIEDRAEIEKIFNERVLSADPKTVFLSPTNCIGEKVSDNHFFRLYMEKIS